MRIIDLLNEIANKKVEFRTKYNWHYRFYDVEIEYIKRYGAPMLAFKDGKMSDGEDRYVGLFERFNYEILNDEVEIIEEKPKEIEELEIKCDEKQPTSKYLVNEFGTKCGMTKHSIMIAEKVNELIKAVNYLLKEKE